jgi:hypothetical protein
MYVRLILLNISFRVLLKSGEIREPRSGLLFARLYRTFCRLYRLNESFCMSCLNAYARAFCTTWRSYLINSANVNK